MKSLGLILPLLICTTSLGGQSGISDLPKDATIVERRPLSIVGYPTRELVMWMINPQRTPSFYSRGKSDPYTCPEFTRGSYLSGPLRVSLVDTQTTSILNTVNISDWQGHDSVDIPYAILKNRFYRTEKESEKVESKPIIMWLHDHLGTGQPLQFGLFDALACMGLRTAVIGYNPKSDRVQQYEAIFRLSEDGKERTVTTTWIDYLLDFKPVARSHWKYQIDYTGRCGSLDRYDFRFVPSADRFEGTVKTGDVSKECR